MTFGECGDLRLNEDGTLSRIDRGGDGEDIRVRKLGAIEDIDARDLRHDERADFAYLADLWKDARDEGGVAGMRQDFWATRGVA